MALHNNSWFIWFKPLIGGRT